MFKVLFIAPSAYPLGGVAIWLNYLVESLPAYGWEPTIGLVAGKWHDVGRYVASYPDVPWTQIKNPTGSREGRLRALESVIRVRRPDVVVGVNIADVYQACERLRQTGIRSIRCVMTLHAIAEDLLGDLSREQHRIDAVICTNRLTCRLCCCMAGMSENLIYYAPYGVDVDSLSRIERAPPDPDCLRIAYVGRFDQEQKRVDLIPDILRQLEEKGVPFRMKIAGGGPMRQNLEAALGPWIADGRAIMLGELPADLLREEVYADADALLVTSSWETGPIVAWEAMAAGAVFVTSRYAGSGLEGALRHDDNCLMFPVGNAIEAARQLSRLNDPGLVARLTERGKRLVKARYTIAQSVAAWDEALCAIRELSPRHLTAARPKPRPAGRLDRLCGVELAERVRKRFGVGFQHRSAGGEWPHSLYSADQAGSEFWDKVYEVEKWLP